MKIIKKSTNFNQSGQVAIVIVLIMVVLLTIGLSLASRTTQEIFLSQQEAESARVFNAAESGIESALSQNFSALTGTETVTDPGITNVSTTTTITPQTTLETQITEGSTVHLDLSGNSPGSNITINWSLQSSCDNSASLIATTYYEDGGEIKAVHDAFGPVGCTGDRVTDGFVTEPSGAGGYSYSHTVILPSTGTLKFMRIKAVYNDAPIQVIGASGTQFYVIRSAADNDLGDESRTIEVKRGLSTAPSFMDYAVYSGGTLEHN